MLIKGFDECSICFKKINNPPYTYKPRFSIGVACEECDLIFIHEQMDIITYVFNTGRGIFEVTEDICIIVKDLLYDIRIKLKLQHKETFIMQLFFQKIIIQVQVNCLNLNTFLLLGKVTRIPKN